MTDNNSYHPLLSDLPDRKPLLPSSRILDNSKFCQGLVNFEITRFKCIYFQDCYAIVQKTTLIILEKLDRVLQMEVSCD